MIVSVSASIQHALMAAAILLSSSVSYEYRAFIRCSALRMSKSDGLNLSSSSSSSSLQTQSQRTDNELKTLMDNMPVDEKYTLLLQSYSTAILERRIQADKSIDLLQNMELLYNEMIQQSIVPQPMAVQAMIDASSKFGNVAVMSKAARLIKAGKRIAAYFDTCVLAVLPYMHDAGAQEHIYLCIYLFISISIYLSIRNHRREHAGLRSGRGSDQLTDSHERVVRRIHPD